ncbi:PAS domain S-box protein [Sphingomonas lutea]|uniref:histidine kinase n=1 Tax=Sphingomonas lutea TaxID=1045317 RepID=A0A7G9SJP4_9SPHN|nr:HWE histidine kinase domain-containing protein [Sphingomonas lutea]QNN68069.1 PAS domain S-box protein [Sphingomonas lutea]
MLDTALDAVCVMDSSGIVVGWNEHAAECFGWRRDEAMGRRLSDLIVPEPLRAAHEAGIVHFLATGEGPVLNRRIEVPALHRDNNQITVELSVTATEQFGERLFIGFIRDISDRRAATERQQRLLQESDHRVKNMLTVVAAIAHQTARASPDVDAFIKTFNGRLEALARSHALLANKAWDEVALTSLAEQVLSADVAMGRARFGGPEILLPPARVLGLSMILHELYTNAVKYGALCTDRGRIDLDWDRKGEEVELVWVETGPPCPRATTSTGFGQRMIAMAVEADLNGSIERDWRPDGLTAVIRFPID